MAINRPSTMPIPKNYSNICFGFDKTPKQSTYYQEYMSGRPSYLDLNRRDYFSMPRRKVTCERGTDDFFKSTFQNDYRQHQPGLYTSIYRERNEQLKKIASLMATDSVCMDESKPLDGSIQRPLTTMSIEYTDRQHLIHNWEAVQAPKFSTIKLTRRLMPNRIERGESEAAHQYQWPVHQPNLIHRVYFTKKAAA